MKYIIEVTAKMLDDAEYGSMDDIFELLKEITR